jgi:signal transduction histidine kinase
MNSEQFEAVRIECLAPLPLLRLYQQVCLGQLAQLLTHEFNNALTSMSGYAQMATTIQREDILLKAARNVLDVSGQLHRLVQNIHGLGQADFDAPAPTDLGQCALLAEQVLAHHLGKRNIRLEVSGHAAHTISGHPVLVTLAMLTYIFDARDRLLAEGGSGEIRIELGGAEHDATVAFSDTARQGSGLGMVAALGPLAADGLPEPRRDLAPQAFHAVAAVHGGRIVQQDGAGGRIIRMEIPYRFQVVSPTG